MSIMKRKSFREMSDIGDDKSSVDNSSFKAVATNTLSKYSSSEFDAIIKNNFVSSRNISTTPNVTNAGSLIEYLLPVHQQMSQIKAEVDKLTQLAPEIKQAKLIRVSSILSPNDLQEGVFTFSLDTLPGLSEEGRKKICDTLSDYFNNTLGLGRMNADWIGESLYGMGAVPVFIFPTSYSRALRNDGLYVSGNSNYETLLGSFDIKKSLDILEKETLFNITAGTENLSDIYYTNKDITKPNVYFTNIVQNSIQEVLPGELLNDSNDFKSFKKGLESVTVKLIKEIEEGDIIKISENPEIVKFASEHRQKSIKNINQKAEDFTNKYMSYAIDELISLNKYDDVKDEGQTGHPIFLVLPCESVIPVCIPNNKSEHIGYFVLLDELGQPLDADPSFMNPMYSWGGSPDAAFNALYGDDAAQSPFSKNSKYNPYLDRTLKIIFEKLMDQFIKSKLKNIGGNNTGLDGVNSLLINMFYRVLEHKKTRIVFIPNTLLTYFCFDYRDNGTGRSVLEDIYFILSLRVTFLVASIMGMSKDAINHKVLNLNISPDETNPAALIKQLVNMFVENERSRFTTDPMDISRNIAKGAITVNPKGIPGLDDFSVEKVTEGTTSIRPDTDLLSKFDTMITTLMSVPYSALNNLGEQEYSRSVATTNLFFCKQTIGDQNTIIPHNEKITKTYIKYSPKLCSIINDIINDAKIPSSDTSGDIDENKNEVTVNLVISNLKLSLPSPNIIQDKAQFEEVTSYIEIVEKYCDILFNDELLPQENTEIVGTLKIVKSFIKKKLIANFIDKVGPVNNLLIPELIDFDQVEVREFIQYLINYNKSFKDVQKFLSPNQDGMGGDTFGGPEEFGDNTNTQEDMFSQQEDINTPSEDEVIEEPSGSSPEEDKENTSTDNQPTDTENTDQNTEV